MENEFDIFISYDNADRQIATDLKLFLENIFLNSGVYVSNMNISGGNIWFENIRNALKSSKVIIVLLTDISINNKWVYFEAGVGLMDDKSIPIVADNISLKKLTTPFSNIQSRVFSQDGIPDLILDISKKLNIKRVPKSISDIGVLLKNTTKIFRMRSAKKLMELVPKDEYAIRAKSQWIYKETCLVFDYIIEDKYEIAIDVYFYEGSSEIQLFQRYDDKMAYLYDTMCAHSNFLPLPLSEYNHVSRLIFKKFNVDDDVELVAASLRDLLRRIEEYIKRLSS